MERHPKSTSSAAADDAPAKLRDELLRLDQIPSAARVDSALYSLSKKHFRDARRPRRVLFRFAVPAAAAAILAGAFGFPFFARDSAPRAVALRSEDLNGDRRVDIRDALFLARRLEDGATLATGWDFNGDRRIDRADVDVVAMQAVRMRSVR